MLLLVITEGGVPPAAGNSSVRETVPAQATCLARDQPKGLRGDRERVSLSLLFPGIVRLQDWRGRAAGRRGGVRRVAQDQAAGAGSKRRPSQRRHKLAVYL